MILNTFPRLMLISAVVVTGCASGGRADPPGSSLSEVLAAELALEARRDFVGIVQDTLRWRLRITVPGLADVDSAGLANVITATYGDQLDPLSPRELYVATDPPIMLGDSARVEARIGSQSSCGTEVGGSFAAYRYSFVRIDDIWRLSLRQPLGYGESGRCRN